MGTSFKEKPLGVLNEEGYGKPVGLYTKTVAQLIISDEPSDFRLSEQMPGLRISGAAASLHYLTWQNGLPEIFRLLILAPDR